MQFVEHDKPMEPQVYMSNSKFICSKNHSRKQTNSIQGIGGKLCIPVLFALNQHPILYVLQQFHQTLPWHWPEQYVIILNDRN